MVGISNVFRAPYHPRAVKSVLLIAPSKRDLAAAAGARYRVSGVGDDLDEAPDLDPRRLVAEAEQFVTDGVVGTKDRSALLAALVAERLGLAGPSPAAVLRCQHKFTSRLVQQRAVPEAVPRFELLEGRPSLAPPFVVKPVVSRLSHGTRVLERLDELPSPDERSAYAASFEAMAALAAAPQSFAGYVVEELVEGSEVTYEGYVRGGAVTTIGVTDSVFYPGTGSFERFEYPSRLPAERWDELSSVADRLVEAIGFDTGFFNVEFRVPDEGPAKIVEINARIASQFAPLVEALHGRSTYDALFALACGDDPAWESRPPGGVAISYVMRVFEDAFVEAVPEPEDGLELLVRPGRRLSEQGVNDAASYRLAIFTEAAETRDEALERCRRRAAALEFRLTEAR